MKVDRENPIRVLHVDDEAGILKVSKQILEMQDLFQVDSAVSVEEAHAKMKPNDYDVIVSDYQMPIKDGLHFLKELRDKGNNIPFILFTGKGREEVAIEALNLGADRYFNKIGKPETVYGELAHSILQVVKRKRSELMLEESEERFKLYVETSPTAVFVANPQAEYEYVNAAASKLLGYSAKELLHMSIPQVAFEQDPTKGLESFVELKKKGTFRGELKLRHKNGEPVYVNLNAVKLPNGKLIAFCENITENKIMTETLKEKLEVLNNLLNNSNFGIGHYDLHGKIILLNRQAREHLKGIPEDYIGKNAKEVFGEYMGNLILKRIKELEVGKNRTFEDELDLPSGKKWFISTYNAILNPKGKLEGVQIISTDITECKKVEAQLEESEVTFRQLFSSMPSGVAVYEALNSGEDFVFKDFNKAAERIDNVSRKDIIGKRVTEVFPGVKDFGLFDVFQRVYLTGLPEFFPSNLYHDSRESGWRENWVYKLPNKHIVAVYNDVTERKKAEEKLIESENRLNTFLEEAPDTVYINDVFGNFVYGNKKAEELTGYRREELIGKNMLEVNLFPEKYFSQIKEGLKANLQGKMSGPNELELIKKDGSTVFIEASSVPIKHDGRTEVIGIARDVSERKRVEAILKENINKYQALVEQSLQGMLILVGSPLSFVFANHSMSNILGYTVEELTSLSPESVLGLIHPEDRQNVLKRSRKRLVGKKVPSHYEFRMIKKNGETCWVEMFCVRIDYVGKPALQATFIDITERKKAERVVNNAFDALALVNEKLGVVGRLTRHDVRNKLSAVTWNIYLAKQTLSSDHEATKFLNETESAIDQIEKIFDFARVYEQLGVEKLSYVDVGESFGRAASLHSDLSGIEVVNDCGGVQVLADSLLDTLFYNLLDNSLKHGEKVSRIKIHCKDCLKLVYEDNGVGIPIQEKEKSFREGYGKGTGLGLYLIKMMCKVYGWTIKETGTQGKGAQFTITIPKEKYQSLNLFHIA